MTIFTIRLAFNHHPATDKEEENLRIDFHATATNDLKAIAVALVPVSTSVEPCRDVLVEHT